MIYKNVYYVIIWFMNYYLLCNSNLPCTDATFPAPADTKVWCLPSAEEGQGLPGIAFSCVSHSPLFPGSPPQLLTPSFSPQLLPRPPSPSPAYPHSSFSPTFSLPPSPSLPSPSPASHSRLHDSFWIEINVASPCHGCTFGGNVQTHLAALIFCRIKDQISHHWAHLSLCREGVWLLHFAPLGSFSSDETTASGPEVRTCV